MNFYCITNKLPISKSRIFNWQYRRYILGWAMSQDCAFTVFQVHIIIWNNLSHHIVY